jgi:hypothetical protein
MPISAHELASIVERASFGAIPNEESLSRNVANEIRRAGHAATIESESSK